MPFLVQTFDKRDSHALRDSLRPEHLEFLDRQAHLLLACGAKLSDDGTQASGGIYLLDVETRQAAEEFIAADPFSRGELFERVEIVRWRKAYLGGRSYLPEGT